MSTINLSNIQEKYRMQRNFSHLFEIIYNKYLSTPDKGEAGSSVLGMGQYLGHGHDGKVRAWKKGQWPSAEDCLLLEQKLGFSLRWLITGEGDPFADTPADTQGENPAVLRAELEQVKQELDEERRLNRQLTTRLLIDGVGDKGAQTSTGKAGDGQG